MVKEYTSLKEAGYHVKVLYAYWAPWASVTDEELFSNGTLDRNDFVMVGGSPQYKKWEYDFSRILFKAARIFTFQLQVFQVWKWALNRPGLFLAREAIKEKADLYIAHNLAALPAALEAACKWNVACGFDAEDYHLGQLDEATGKEARLVKKIEDSYIPRCTYISAASPLIGKTYSERLQIKNIPIINNVFSIQYLQPEPMPYRPGDTLKLFWFSQTVGAGRGLEEVIAAMGKAKTRNISCTILGSCSPGMKTYLLSIAASNDVQEQRLRFIEPVLLPEIFRLSAGHHIGLATETGMNLNNEIALSNKILSYPLAGLAIVASDTDAQQLFLEDHPATGRLYKRGDTTGLAGIFDFFMNNPDRLNEARQNAYDLAKGSLNWECEKKVLLETIKRVL